MDNGLLIAGLIFVLVMLAGFLAFYYSNLYKKRKDISERIRKEATPVALEALTLTPDLAGLYQKINQVQDVMEGILLTD